MKKLMYLLILVLFAASSACTKKITILNKGVPPGQVKKQTAPGQVKKTTGTQSAQPNAPGQKGKKKN